MANILYPLVHTHSPTRQQANSKMPLQPPTINAQYSSTNLPPQESGFSIPEPINSRHIHLPESSSLSNSRGREAKNMARRKSAGLPTHLNLQGTGYGYASSNSHKLQPADYVHTSTDFSLKDVMSIVLIPLPFCLASQLLQTVVSTVSDQDGPGTMDGFAEMTLLTQSLPLPLSITLVSSLTAFILALLGISAKLVQLQKTQDKTDRQPTLAGLQQMNYYELGRIMLLRCLVIALPLFSVSCIGGARVVIIALSTIAAGLWGAEALGSSLETWKSLILTRKYLLGAIALQMIADVAGITSQCPFSKTVLGYSALLTSIVALPIVYPTSKVRKSKLSLHQNVERSARAQPSEPTSSYILTIFEESTLISSPADIDLTLISAGLLGLFAIVIFVVTNSSAGARPVKDSFWFLLAGLSFSASFIFSDTRSLRKAKYTGTLVGSVMSLASNVLARSDIGLASKISMTIFVVACYAGLLIDVYISTASQSNKSRHIGKHNHDPDTSLSQMSGASRITNFLLPHIQAWPLLHTIIRDKDSRRIFYFMCLNFAFMMVQTFYGIVSGSLGLLSDSIHMFFDCLALVVGLCAAVMSRWPPSARFPYGYAKIETLAGFANGIFLMLISVEIIYEAIERLSEGTDVRRLNELLTVSIMGLIINVVGILAFGHAHHGHDHSHGHSHHHGHDHSHDHSHHHVHDHSHGHSHQHGHSHKGMNNFEYEGDQHHHGHGNHIRVQSLQSQDQQSHQHPHGHDHTEPHNARHDHSHDENEQTGPVESFPKLNGDFLSVPSPISSMYGSVPATPSKPSYAFNDHAHKTHNVEQKHSHDHHHHSENMMGIYLHVIGDTLGSLAVVVSTWLVQWNGWSGWDPVASTAIAIIIFFTAIPLVKNCAKKLLLTVPDDVEYDLREALAGLSGLRGIVGCTVPKFWIQDGEQRQIMGTVHVMAERSSNLEDVKERSLSFLTGAGLNVLVQVEREGTSRCWCQASR